MFDNPAVLIVAGLFIIICVFVIIVYVRLLVCCFLEITMAAFADVQLTNGCCLKDCGVEHFRPSWPNKVFELLVVQQLTHRLMSEGIVRRQRDWRSWAWQDGEKGVPLAALLVLLLDSAVVIVCTRPHRCHLRERHLRRLPISRYVYSHHTTPARRCDPLSGGITLRIS
jgi:hypothetical protein